MNQLSFRKNKAVLLLLLFINVLLSPVSAANFEFQTYDWDSLPKPHTLNAKEAKENSIILKDKRIIEYALEKNDFVKYVTRHLIVKVNTDIAIERNNKVYIPMSDVYEMVILKARSISPSGKITLLNPDNIKDVENLENSGPFKIFAIEGIETGSEIEYLYTVLKRGDYFGTEVLQSDIQRKNTELKIISPEQFIFEAKAYNTSIPVKKDSSLKGKNRCTISIEETEALKPEKYAAYENNLVRIEYKLAYEQFHPKKRLFTWNNAAENYTYLLNKYSSKAKSKVKKLLKEIKVKGLPEEEAVRRIESYVKTNFVLKEVAGPDFSDLENIVKNKYANETGLLRLFVALFNEASISNELVITSDRYHKRFDEDFDTWNYLQHYLIYFPTLDNFLAPTEPFSRLGFFPYSWTDNKGLFIKMVEVSSKTTPVAKIGKIEPKDFKESMNQIDAKVRFTNDFETTEVTYRQTFTGYLALSIQPVYGYLSGEQKKEVLESFFKSVGQDAVISDVKVENYKEEDILRKPFITEANLKLSSLVERAGNKYLFKVGNIIGPQTELYQENVRKNDVEVEFNHGYIRNIEIEVPEGYRFTNLDQLNQDVFHEENNERTMEFRSSYVIEGKKVKVTVIENYRKTHFPKQDFPAFQKVINAAADFNKKVLFLEKE